MAAGLQIWDASGNLILDTESMVLKFVTGMTITGTGSVNVDNYVADRGTSTVVPVTLPEASSGKQTTEPGFSVSGSTLSYTQQRSDFHVHSRLNVMLV
jgi:hypothetical protein